MSRTLFDAAEGVELAAQHVVAEVQGPSTFDSPTSWLAAHANRVRSGGQRRRCLEQLALAASYGKTDYELGLAVGILRTAAGTRRKELADLGLVEVTARTRDTDMGSPAVVHMISDFGRAVALELMRNR